MMWALTSALLLSFLASALAYNITIPNAVDNWNITGPNIIAWVNQLATDPLNFTAVLTNPDRSVMPIDNQELAALVDGTLGSIVAKAPSGGWPVGAGFRVNLVPNPESLGIILAQSLPFKILNPTNSSTTSSATVAATAGQPALTSSSEDPLAKPTGAPSGAQAVSSATLQVAVVSTIAILAVFLA